MLTRRDLTTGIAVTALACITAVGPAKSALTPGVAVDNPGEWFAHVFVRHPVGFHTWEEGKTFTDEMFAEYLKRISIDDVETNDRTLLGVVGRDVHVDVLPFLPIRGYHRITLTERKQVSCYGLPKHGKPYEELIQGLTRTCPIVGNKMGLYILQR